MIFIIDIYYDTIDEILYRIDYNLDFDDLDIDKVKKVKELMRKAQHKLRPPPSYTIKQE